MITAPEYTATIGIARRMPSRPDGAAHKVGLYIYDSLGGSKHLDTAGHENVTVASDVVAWVLFAFYLHGWLIGVRPLG